MNWRLVLVPLFSFLVFVRPSFSSGPDPERPIKQMRHTTWNEANGLSGKVWAITQTADGFLWIGTSTGLYRFDGVRFDPYRDISKDHTILEVRALLATSDGGLWIAHRNGIAFIKDDHARFYDDQQGLPYGRARSLAQTPDGAIWAGIVGGLARFADGRWERVRTNWNYQPSSAQNLSVGIDGTLWVVGGHTAQYLSRGQNKFRQLGISLDDWTSLTPSPDGSMWLEDEVQNTLSHVQNTDGSLHVTTAKFVPDVIRAMFDHTGSLWIASEHGVERLAPGVLSTAPSNGRWPVPVDNFLPVDGLTDVKAFRVFEDREGNVWIGTYSGLDRFSDRSVTQLRLTETPEHLIVGPHGDIWANNPTGSSRLVPIYGKNPIVARNCNGESFYISGDETLWAEYKCDDESKGRALWMFRGEKSTVIPYPQGMSKPITKGIIGDAEGRLWLTISGYGEYTLKDGTWEYVPVFSGKDHDLAPDAQFSDAMGRVWLIYYARNVVVMWKNKKATYFRSGENLNVGSPIVGWSFGDQVWITGTRGVVYFDGQQFQMISGAKGATFADVTAILPSEDGGLWLKSPTGVIQIPGTEVRRFLRDHKYSVQYRIFDGGTDFFLQLARGTPATSGDDITQGADRKIRFPTIDGVAVIDPSHLAMNTVEPPVFIRGLVADGQHYPVGNTVLLPALTKSIAFDYTALSLTFSERNRFRYRLEGFDKDWQDVETRRQAFYTNLPPGTYTFRVLAANNDGVWNNVGTSVTFRVAPAFFQTLWFKLLLVVAAAFVLWGLYSLRLRQATADLTALLGERLRERERIASELHDTLLQDFQAVILRFEIGAKRLPKDDKNRAFLEEGVEYADKVLTEGRHHIRNIRAGALASDELPEALLKYAEEISQVWPLQFSLQLIGSSVRMSPIVRDEIYRIGREAMCNAFKHSNGTKVDVDLEYGPDEFCLRVRDDGEGIAPDLMTNGRAGHWGIINMRERAKQLGATLEIRAQHKEGTCLDICIPIRLLDERRRYRLRWLRRLFAHEASLHSNP